MLANKPNPLFQGISSNHKPQKKPPSTLEFNPQAERVNQGKPRFNTPKIMPLGSNERETRDERNKAKGINKRLGNQIIQRENPFPSMKEKPQRDGFDGLSN